MAIAIASDLVLDVVKAANPDRARVAQASLQGGTGRAGPTLQFADAVRALHQKPGLGRLLPSDAVAGMAVAADNRVDPKQKAYQQFEAGILRNFVEEMLPKSTDTLYGAGTAGNVWRSMQADFMSQELAKSGGIGIASTLARLDEEKSHAQSGASLNELPQRPSSAANSISNTNEWPYFSRPEIGVLES